MLGSPALLVLAATNLTPSLRFLAGTACKVIVASQASGNKHGFEDGSLRRLDDGTLHMLVSEEFGDPKWVRMRLAHWTTRDANGLHGWERIGTLSLDGTPMVSSANCSASRFAEHVAAYWSPVAFFDASLGAWTMTYIGYSCPGNQEGVVRCAKHHACRVRWRLVPTSESDTQFSPACTRLDRLAVSATPGPLGIGGPYTSHGAPPPSNASVLLSRFASNGTSTHQQVSMMQWFKAWNSRLPRLSLLSCLQRRSHCTLTALVIEPLVRSGRSGKGTTPFSRFARLARGRLARARSARGLTMRVKARQAQRCHQRVASAHQPVRRPRPMATHHCLPSLALPPSSASRIGVGTLGLLAAPPVRWPARGSASRPTRCRSGGTLRTPSCSR